MSKFLKTIALIGGGALVVNEIQKSSDRSANVPKALTDRDKLIQDVKAAIKADPLLMGLLTGPSGPAGSSGSTGSTGATGPHGLDGSVLGSVYFEDTFAHATGTDTVHTVTHNLGLINPTRVMTEVLNAAGIEVTAYKVTSPLANTLVITILAANASGNYTAKIQAAAIPVPPQRFGGSLLTNGAFESGNLAKWEAAPVIEAEFHEGMPVASITRSVAYAKVTHAEYILLRHDRLYKMEAVVSCDTEYVALGLKIYDKDKVAQIPNTMGSVAEIAAGVSSATTLTKLSAIFGGAGSAVKNVKSDTVYGKFVVFGGATATGGKIKFSKFMVTEIPLGESVSYTYSGLPTGQEVHDPATGDRGRYNGSTIDWYTMA